jgi:hypothetical protein
VRKELAKHGDTFTYRVPIAGTAWDPSRSRFNPTAGPAEVTFRQQPDGSVTTSEVRPDWAK